MDLKIGTMSDEKGASAVCPTIFPPWNRVGGLVVLLSSFTLHDQNGVAISTWYIVEKLFHQMILQEKNFETCRICIL